MAGGLWSFRCGELAEEGSRTKCSWLSNRIILTQVSNVRELIFELERIGDPTSSLCSVEMGSIFDLSLPSLSDRLNVLRKVSLILLKYAPMNSYCPLLWLFMCHTSLTSTGGRLSGIANSEGMLNVGAMRNAMTSLQYPLKESLKLIYDD